jgi:N-methylhydantoinase A
MAQSVAVDIGGTFTDLVVLDLETGATSIAKAPSTPSAFVNGLLAALERGGVDLSRVTFFVHGTTVGLNAVIEGKGARSALITTKGFRDVYEIGRTDKPGMYDNFYRKPRTLVPRRLIYEVDERVSTTGEILREADMSEIAAINEHLSKSGVQSVAVCTLNSYVNGRNEKAIGDALTALNPDLGVSLSHEIWGEWREFERTSTTVFNAYIQPLVQGYLETLEAELARRSYSHALHIMQSNGGIMSVDIARLRSIQTLQSGPAGGVIGAERLANLLSEANIVAIDIGGTSCDVSLIVDGKMELAVQTRVFDLPVLLPSIRIDNFGAGGGSIARIEGGAALRVGPESAGPDPGPACYALGGTQPTVTDANVVLGRLEQHALAASGLEIDVNLAEQAVRSGVAGPLGMDTAACAEGIVRVVNGKIANAIRELTVGRGLSPKNFALLAFGGAGPMHAAEIASEAGISRVIVPRVPGTFSAWGMLFADFRQDLVQTVVSRAAETSMDKIVAAYEVLEAKGHRLLTSQHVDQEQQEFIRQLDLRYLGQEHTLTVIAPKDLIASNLKTLFDEAHRLKFGYQLGDPVEIVNVRLAALGRTQKPNLEQIRAGSPSSQHALLRKRKVYFHGGFSDAAIYNRSKFQSGNTVKGPAIIEEIGSTTVLPPGAEMQVDRYGNLVIEVGQDWK